MVIKYNTAGQDIGYIRNEGDDFMQLRVQPDQRTKNSSCTLNADGFYEIVLDFEMREGDTLPLQIETWVACSFLVDDIVLSEV